MSERGSREGSSRRSSFRKSLSETALPPHYLAQLEEKRKQLDESIHKYIAAKEREYKLFEKDLRQQHRAGNGGDVANGTSKRRGSPESSQGESHTVLLESQKISAVDTLLGSATRRDPGEGTAEVDDESPVLNDRSTIAGLKDRRASLEREKDFVGVFTPSFLPALDYREDGKLERTSSAPSTIQPSSAPSAVTLSNSTATQDESGSLERANSDSMVQAQAKPRRPSHLALVQRTSSSGSSADGKLASAMKSTLLPPKRKRVSLAVGDTIVAPSDSVPLALSQHSSSSHSRIRYAVPDREYPASAKRSTKDQEERSDAIESSLLVAEDVALANAIGADKEVLPERLAAVAVSESTRKAGSPKPGSSSKLDADGDLFGLEDEDDDDRPSGNDVILPEEVDEGAIESDDEVTGRIYTAEEVTILDKDAEQERYDPTTGFIPEPADGTDNAVPYLAFGPSSAIASQQPTQPGFRRPSVVYDPIYEGKNYRAAERDAVENEIYGSSFNRPTGKGSFTAGSLGESYMAQHAEEMLKLRHSRKEAQVRS